MSNNKVVLAPQPGGGLLQGQGSGIAALFATGSCQKTCGTWTERPQRLKKKKNKKNPNSLLPLGRAARARCHPSCLPACCLHPRARAACTHVLRLPARCLHPHARLARTIVASTHVLRLPAPTCPGCPQRCLHPCTQAACTLPVPCDFGVIYTLFGVFTSQVSVSEAAEQGTADSRPQPRDYFQPGWCRAGGRCRRGDGWEGCWLQPPWTGADFGTSPPGLFYFREGIPPRTAEPGIIFVS